ncbi:hypothetical protein GE061_010917 [Apolygus lucorum]|uniref:Peptidase S1 domain-containing protein n=1 Tax=Apolygus lucorum TaxID=248454 RepID=A0A8S9XY30_APOLU|nr:hypothetical protein GE061_010917 [Apolygus lucorum]
MQSNLNEQGNEKEEFLPVTKDLTGARDHDPTTATSPLSTTDVPEEPSTDAPQLEKVKEDIRDSQTSTSKPPVIQEFQNFVTIRPENISKNENQEDSTVTDTPDSNSTTTPTVSTRAPLVPPYPGGQFPPKPFRLEPAPVTEEVEDFSAFEANKQSILQWIASLLAGYGVGGEQSPQAPEPVDPSKCKPCSCGLTNKKNRIVGGKETEINEYPWMCLLTYHGEFYCGGTLINHRYVLTAAHCVSGFRASRIRVRLLEHNQKLDNETTLIERGVSKVIKHAGYSTVTLDNDIALLKLDEDVEIEDEFMPACLPPLKKSFAGETGIVTGWGVTAAGKLRGDDIRAHISPVLQELEVPIMSNEECRNSGYMKNQITDNMLCAGFKEGGKDSCQGDSGGPLHVADGIHHQVVGVVSWGQGCARPNYPGVYNRVNRYIPWIQKYTADACPCSRDGGGYKEPVIAEGEPVEEETEEEEKEDEAKLKKE